MSNQGRTRIQIMPPRLVCLPPTCFFQGSFQEDWNWLKGMLSYNQYHFSVILPASGEDAREKDSPSLQPCSTRHLKTPAKWFSVGFQA